MRRHQVRKHVLLQTGIAGGAVELLNEALVELDAGLSHDVEHALRNMLGREPQLSADVMPGKLFHEFLPPCFLSAST